MTFVPKGNPENRFDFNASPDCGAMVSLISEDLVIKHGLYVDKKRRVIMQAANSTKIQCSGTTDGSGEHRYTRRSIELPLVVSRDLKNEILISYWDLVRFRVVHPLFPFTECTRRPFEEEEPYEARRAAVIRADLREMGDSYVMAENRIMFVKCPETESKIKDDLIKEFAGTVSDEISSEPVKCDPIEIKLKDGPVKPIQVTRARPVEFHFQDKAYRLIKGLEDRRRYFDLG